MIVVDSNVWVSRLVGALGNAYHELLRGEVVGPPHVDFEVGSALLRLERHGVLGDAVTARRLFARYMALRFERVRHEKDAVHAYDLVNNASYADAIFLAMARRLECPVMTADNGMIEAARIHGVRVVDIRALPS